MSTFDRSIRLTAIGWALVAVFAVFVGLGPDGWANAALYAVIAVVLGSWVWFRRSRPALVVGLVVGGLQALEQIGYVVADLSDGDPGRAPGDLVGLAGGVCVIVGSVLALRASRRQVVGADL